ncbi:hypothetical protein O6H91_06G067900 [Diphasiastrum complanatum]|uniref:Uncharacterized protein n=1 Tax=Diphasiastrum complanatum TaxID=34168 RepID=A0ACC2DEI5_DIPCM|nr:hypothetical protein O6H91_06G067900 [Diphasiastrum complanatum]
MSLFTSEVKLGGVGQEVSMESQRYKNCLREIRERANDVVDEQTGVHIKREDWLKLKLHIVSENNFPTAAGLASSAAGFACLVYTLAQLMGVNERYQGELSAIARLGSGSACRSLDGGFVKWDMGQKEDGADSIAVQIANETHWKDLVIFIAVVSSRQKEVSSTSGMQETVQTSPFLHFRAKDVVPKRIKEMEDAVARHDFSSFARITCADSNQFHATCLDTSPPIFYLNDTSKRLIGLVERWNTQEGSPQAAYTFDAGPNAVLFTTESNSSLLLQRLLFQFPPAPGVVLSSYVVGDLKTLELAGIKSLKDLASLEPPKELAEPKIPLRTPGELAYIICTRPGRGAFLLKDLGSSLIDSTSGLPFSK